MPKRFTIAIGQFSLSAESLRASSYASPEPIWAYDTNSAKQVHRILTEIINGKTRRAKEIHAKQKREHGMKMRVLTVDGDLPLRAFMLRYANEIRN